MTNVVIGVGNTFRRDDGVGPAVAEAIAEMGLAGTRVLAATGEPGELLEAWDGVSLAIVIDAAVADDTAPGRIRRWVPGCESAIALSSHQLGLPATYALGEALGRVPEQLVVFTVDASDVGHGDALTPEVAAAVPRVTAMVLAEIDR